VHGECKVSTASYEVELKRHEPQGINPKDLLLTRIVHEPSGPVAEVETVVEVRYQEETDLEYDTAGRPDREGPGSLLRDPARFE
jgi:hypothetical protein